MKARAGDRTAIEAALSPALRAALDEMCALLEIPRDRWQAVPALRAAFETAAVIREGRRLFRRPGFTTAQMLCDEIAADTLGVESAAVETRRRRWRRFGHATD
jgi:hypothetical protein